MAGGKEDLSNFTGQPELQLECTHTNQIMSLYLKVKGEHVLVGDLVRSVTLLRYKPAEKVLQEVARDFNSSYLRAVEIMDGTADDIFVGADINGNLQCLRQVADAVTDEERCKLESCGEFHVSEYINAFHRGSLVGQPIDADAVQSHSGTKSGAAGESTSGGSVLSAKYHSVTGLKPGTCSVLYGGVTGAIGNIIALSEDSHRFFSAVERVMKRSVVSIGGLNHREWRSFQNDLRSAPQRNMVDGDLVEMLLEYDKEALAGIVREINDEVNAATAAINAAAAGGVKANGSTAVTTSPTGNMLLSLAEMKIDLSVEDVLHRIEDISRLH
jgi:DNA damage-binding protein 1